MSATKLSSIYSALDNGNNKNAIKLCNGTLQKQPHNTTAKALKALALQRLGKADEALPLLDEIKLQKPKDPELIRVANCVYHAVRKEQDAQEMCEVAYQQDPDNEELAVAYFYCLLRTRDYAKQQQVAMKMSKKFSKPKYLRWSLMAILMSSGLDGAGSRTLDLAEMMLAKAPLNVPPRGAGAPPATKGGAASTLRESYGLFLLHMSVLRLKGKYAEALELLGKCESCTMVPLEDYALRVQLEAERGRLDKAIEAVRRYLLHDKNQWCATEVFVRLSVERSLQAGRQREDDDPLWTLDFNTRVNMDEATANRMSELGALKTSDPISDAYLMLRHVRDGIIKFSDASITAPMSEPPSPEEGRRWALCAELELRKQTLVVHAEKKLRKKIGDMSAQELWGVASQPEGASFIGLIDTYAAEFGGSPTCFYELRPYLAFLDEVKARQLSGLLRPRVVVPQDGHSNEKRPVRQYMSLHKILHALRWHMPIDKAERTAANGGGGGGDVERVAEWLCVYTGHLHLDQDKSSMSYNTVDELTALAAEVLVEMDERQAREAHRQGKTVPLAEREAVVSALAVLEMCLAHSEYNFHARFLSLLIYSHLGLGAAAQSFIVKLDFKNVQYEALGYTLFDTYLDSAMIPEALEVCKEMCELEADFYRQTQDAMQNAYEHESYGRVADFTAALDRMKRSMQPVRAEVMEGLMNLQQALGDTSQGDGFGDMALLVQKDMPMLRKHAGMSLSWYQLNQDRQVHLRCTSVPPFPALPPSPPPSLTSVIPPATFISHPPTHTQPQHTQTQPTATGATKTSSAGDDDHASSSSRGSHSDNDGGVASTIRKVPPVRCASVPMPVVPPVAAAEGYGGFVSLFLPRFQEMPACLKMWATALSIVCLLYEKDLDEASRMLSDLRHLMAITGIIQAQQPLPRPEHDTALPSPPTDDTDSTSAAAAADAADSTDGTAPAPCSRLWWGDDAHGISSPPPPWDTTSGEPSGRDKAFWRMTYLCLDVAHRVLEACGPSHPNGSTSSSSSRPPPKPSPAPASTAPLAASSSSSLSLADGPDPSHTHRSPAVDDVSVRAGSTWEDVERGLEVLTQLLPDVMRIGGGLETADESKGKEAGGTAEAAGGGGGGDAAVGRFQRFMWDEGGCTGCSRFLLGPLLFVTALFPWIAQTMPRARKDKDKSAGPSAVHAARIAFKGCITAYVSELTRLSTILGRARQAMADKPSDAPTGGLFPDQGELTKELDVYRRSVATQILSSQRQQLHRLNELVQKRLQVLRKITFKP
ncbi:unnamed protein product [Vitrella brassicaformis CCMP3155]|uniref:Cyclic nucleotide-binding domain-containing protein n=2 Tax=Vitrella brassicaformis TaxID=1169539 RepID=A0A0G4FF01_VITBC|nr:unnamed protein product [Vitrella brassicaformis CCMP3155]|eukprot:CEM11610.1 unnamed protein product [Vitrella brassicaformis CCMP3155]